jgi:hypothetical protein
VISIFRFVSAPSGKTYGTGDSWVWTTALSTKFAQPPVSLSTRYPPLWTTRGQGCGDVRRAAQPPIANISTFGSCRVAAVLTSE